MSATPEQTAAAEQSAARELRRIARRAAAPRGMEPHEFLAAIARGDPIEQVITTPIIDRDTGVITGYRHDAQDVYPDLELRIDAAKAAAPYYAPRLTPLGVAPSLRDGASGDRFRQLSDHELNAAISLLSDQRGNIVDTSPESDA